jgi:hypothetical protein
MTENFEIEAEVNKETKRFLAEFRQLGYSYKIAVWIDDHEIIYEPDEERKFRAISLDAGLMNDRKFVEWVRVIGEKLSELFGS